MLFVELLEREQNLETAVARALEMLRHRGIRSFRLPTVIAVAKQLSPELEGLDVPEEQVRRVLRRTDGVEERGHRWHFTRRDGNGQQGQYPGGQGLGMDVPGLV